MRSSLNPMSVTNQNMQAQDAALRHRPQSPDRQTIAARLRSFRPCGVCVNEALTPNGFFTAAETGGTRASTCRDSPRLRHISRASFSGRFSGQIVPAGVAARHTCLSAIDVSANLRPLGNPPAPRDFSAYTRGSRLKIIVVLQDLKRKSAKAFPDTFAPMLEGDRL